MLWLMLLLLWSSRVVLGGPSAATPATRAFYLPGLLGILQVIVITIDILEFTIAIVLD